MERLSANEENFRVFMRRMAQPVTVITARAGNRSRGMTASSFVSLSLDPVLVCFNVSNGSRMQRLLEGTDRFVVNMLSDRQAESADHFARPDLTAEQQFRGREVESTESGIPVLKDSLGALECTIVQRLRAGDHFILVGEVRDIRAGNPELGPLLYHNRQYETVGSKALLQPNYDAD